MLEKQLNTYYEYYFDEINSEYSFYSIGSNGKFKKRVLFKKFGNSPFWELILEDYIEKLDFYSINTVTNNNDVDKIYATMFSIMIDYSKIFPNRLLMTKGTTQIIQRLDKIFIHRYFETITNYFNIRMYHDSIAEYTNKDFNSSINCTGYFFYPKKRTK
ncbi:MAG: hypothetical protein AB7O47_10630 [Flavobacteriales bacterium]